MVQLLYANSVNIINTFSSIAECDKYQNGLPQTMRLRAQKNTRFLFKGKLVYLRLVK